MVVGSDVVFASRGRFTGGGRETGVSVMSILFRCCDLCLSFLVRRRCSLYCCFRVVGGRGRVLV